MDYAPFPTRSHPQTPPKETLVNTDAIMVSLKNIPVGDCDNVLHFVSAKQNNRQPNDDLAESLFSSPPASPQKKCIQPNIKGHSVLECKKMLALQQDIEELEFYPKLRVFWGHETHQKLQKDSQNSHAKRGKRLKCGKNKAKILVDISELPSLITLACVQSPRLRYPDSSSEYLRKRPEAGLEIPA